jgi:hypothetical protein
MFADVRYAIRQLKKSPGFAVTAVLTLALGIGVNAVVFSVMNTIVLHPLTVPHPQNLFMVQRFQYPSQSYPDYRDLRDRNRTFDNLITYNIMGPAGLAMGGDPKTVWPYEASGNYFDALGIQPHLGRFFHASDEHGPNSAPYIVLSYATWHSLFHDDRGVIGQIVQLNKHPYTIIGVAPPEFRGTELFFAPALWAPIVQQQQLEGYSSLEERGNHSGFVVGRLKGGVTPSQATADLNTIGASLAKAYPGEDDGVKFTLARPGLVGDMLGGAGAGIYGGAPAPLRAHPAGGLCEPRQPVRGSRRRSLQRNRGTHGPRIEARPHPPAVAHGSSSCLACRWGGWPARRHRHFALADCVAAHPGHPHQYSRQS